MVPTPSTTSSTSRAGFTLFEVILVLSLTAIVMLLVSGAIRLQLRMSDSRGDAVENAQLARVIMRRISNDLRAAIYEEIESESDDATAEQIDPTGAIAPGIYGDMEQIRIDMVQAVDTRDWFASVEPETAVMGTELVPKPLGSLQSVAYFLNDGAMLTAGNASAGSASGAVAMENSGTMDAVGGLIRQIVDYPVASWALDGGGNEDLELYSQLYAPEVASLGFRYFDGTTWNDMWDSYEQLGLPVAVEVTLVLMSPSEAFVDQYTSQDIVMIDPDSIYTMVVHIPTAVPTDDTP